MYCKTGSIFLTNTSRNEISYILVYSFSKPDISIFFLFQKDIHKPKICIDLNRILKLSISWLIRGQGLLVFFFVLSVFKFNEYVVE